MRYILHGLLISLLLSCNSSFAMQQLLNTNATVTISSSILAGAVVCLLIYQDCKDQNYSFFAWVRSFFDEKKDDQTIVPKGSFISQPLQQLVQTTSDVSNKPTQNNTKKFLTPEKLVELTKQRKEKEENEKKRKEEEIPGDTALHRACDDNDIEQVRLLLQQGDIDINALRKTVEVFSHHDSYGYRCIKTKRGGTALHIACNNQNRAIIDLLLAQDNVDVSLTDNYGVTPLYFAIQHNGRELINKLLAHSTMKFTNNRCLRIACEKEFTDLVQQLLEYNIDDCMKINAPFKKNDALLTKTCKALKICEQLMVMLMYKNGVLATDESIRLADKLQDFGFSHENYQRLNELHKKKQQDLEQEIEKEKSRREKLIAIITLLVQHEHIIIDKAKVFPLIVGSDEILKLLWEMNCLLPEEERYDINTQRKEGRTLLHEAACMGNKTSFFFLLKNGADISIKDKYGRTPLNNLCKQVLAEIETKSTQTRYKDILCELLNSGHVTPEIIDESGCLGQSISRGKNNYLPELLLKYGANPHNKNWGGVSPVVKAGWCNVDLLNLLIAYGADIADQNEKNKTVFYNAFMYKIIQKPDDITYFKNLNVQEKVTFMERELSVLVDNGLQYAFSDYGLPYDEESANRAIKKFNAFVDLCASYTSNTVHFFNEAYLRTEERRKNFLTTKKCMYPTNACPFNGSDHKCKTGFDYNEVVMHALIRHTNKDGVDKQIALIYQESPGKYYMMKEEEKQEHKKTLMQLELEEMKKKCPLLLMASQSK